MKLLTATHEGQGDRAGDFCFAAEGELVMLGEMCATDRNDPLGGCGCSRAFAGLASQRATTTALVRDLDLTRYDIELAVTAQFAADGLSAHAIGDEEYAELFTATVDEMVRFGTVWPAGTVVRRVLDSVTIQ